MVEKSTNRKLREKAMRAFDISSSILREDDTASARTLMPTQAQTATQEPRTITTS